MIPLSLFILFTKSRSIDFVNFFLYLRYIISNYNVSYLWKQKGFQRSPHSLLSFVSQNNFYKVYVTKSEKIKRHDFLKKLFLEILWIQTQLTSCDQKANNAAEMPITPNGLQLNFSLGFGTVFYRIATDKAKCLLAICKAKIN